MENFLWLDSEQAVHFIGFRHIQDKCYLHVDENLLILSANTLPKPYICFKLDISRLTHARKLIEILKPGIKQYFYYEETLNIYISEISKLT